MKYFKHIIIFIFINFLTLNSFANEFVGIIGAGVGEVKNQNNQKLQNGSKIFYGDTIIVGSKSTAQVLFLDQTVMTLGEILSLQLMNLFMIHKQMTVNSYQISSLEQ